LHDGAGVSASGGIAREFFSLSGDRPDGIRLQIGRLYLKKM
jgi:hypothetical protein